MTDSKFKVLVAGASGMTGSHIVYNLLKKNIDVLASFRNAESKNNILQTISFYEPEPHSFFDKINWVQADFTDYNQAEQAVEGCSFVINSAARISFNRKHKAKIIAENVAITSNIVNACLQKKIKKLCHISSIAALGENLNGNESSETDSKFNFKNASGYSISKYESEMEVWRGIAEGLNAVIVNPSIILGPGNWNSGSSAIFKNVYNNLKFYTEGVNGFTDVRDVAEIVYLLLMSDKSAERYIINSENTSYKNIIDNIADNINKKKPSVKANNFLLETARILEYVKYAVLKTEPRITKETVKAALKKSFYSNLKIKSELNFDFIPVEKSISDFSKIFLDNSGFK